MCEVRIWNHARPDEMIVFWKQRLLTVELVSAFLALYLPSFCSAPTFASSLDPLNQGALFQTHNVFPVGIESLDFSRALEAPRGAVMRGVWKCEGVAEARSQWHKCWRAGTEVVIDHSSEKTRVSVTLADELTVFEMEGESLDQLHTTCVHSVRAMRLLSLSARCTIRRGFET